MYSLLHMKKPQRATKNNTLWQIIKLVYPAFFMSAMRQNVEIESNRAKCQQANIMLAEIV
jgi:hypothetical protein